MSKKKGSAMVLAILLLAFFMALSLNMWFISQKKAQRAGDKVIGNQVLTDIDGSSTLGYYEFYLATEYITKGFVTSSNYTSIPAITTSYSSISSSGIEVFSTTFEGIKLDKLQEYFGSYLSTSGALSTSANAILRQDVITGAGIGRKLTSREWLTTGGAIITELWNASNWTQESFGGYRIDSVTVGGAPVIGQAAFAAAMGITTKTAITLYRKTIYFPSVTAKLKPVIYDIIVERESVIRINGSTFDYTSDDINEITVTKQ